MCVSFKPLAKDTEKASIARPMPKRIAFVKNNKSIKISIKKLVRYTQDIVPMYNKIYMSLAI